MTTERKLSAQAIPEWVDTVTPTLITLKVLPEGENTLCHEAMGEGLKSAAKTRHQKEEWWIWSLLLLPDRMLALVSISPETSSQMAVGNWKRFTDRTLKINWQRGFKEIPIEDQEALDAAAAQLKVMPVEAGLCESTEAWSYLWTSDDLSHR